MRHKYENSYRRFIKEFVTDVFVIRLEKPEDVNITIANAYQIFWRHAGKFGFDTKTFERLSEVTIFQEYEADKKKLDKIKVLSIEIEKEEVKEKRPSKIKQLKKDILDLLTDRNVARIDTTNDDERFGALLTLSDTFKKVNEIFIKYEN